MKNKGRRKGRREKISDDNWSKTEKVFLALLSIADVAYFILLWG